MGEALAREEGVAVRRALDRYGSVTSEDELIRRHAPMIDRCARALARRTGCDSALDDFWSAGAMGLLEAYRRYEPTREASFESFAEHRVRGAMLDELRKLDHLPRRLRADTEKLNKARSKLQHELDRDPTDEELSTATGFDLVEIAHLEGLAQPVVPVDFELPSGGPAADEQLSKSRLVKALAETIQTLPERLQVIASLCYVEGLTYREIGKILQVSEPRVCQLHREIIQKLRAGLESTGINEDESF